MEQEKGLIEKIRFYLNDTSKVAEALLLIRNTEKILEEAKEKVKERAVEIMDQKQIDLISYSITDQETGEIREWEVKRSYGSQAKEYRPENVFEVLGDDAFKYFKVGKVKLEKDLAKLSAKGTLTMEQVTAAVRDPKITQRKGAGVVMREVKER